MPPKLESRRKTAFVRSYLHNSKNKTEGSKDRGGVQTELTKGLERFQALGIKRVAADAVLYDGERSFSVQGVRILNSFLAEDRWGTLTGLSEREGP